MSLTPILVSGYGRSGTTAVMELLGTSPRIAFDRRYPYENRWLTYLAKFARLATGATATSDLSSDALCDFDISRLGGLPWPTDPIAGQQPAIAVTDGAWIDAVWSRFSVAARERFPAATHYAEKAPAWLAAAVRDEQPVRTIHLVRDPRDVFLSATAFNRARGSRAFGRKPGDSDRDHARNIAHALLLYYENQQADQDRTDCVTIRFEDLIEDRPSTVERLSRFLNLDLPAEAPESAHLPAHRTSENAVSRWKREPLPVLIRQLLETHLSEAMAANGYELSSDMVSARDFDLARCAAVAADGNTVPVPERGLAIQINGPDFWVELPAANLSARDIAEVWVCLRGDTGVHGSLYWRRPREAFDEGRCVHVPFHPGRHWQVIRFPVASHPHWHGTIAQMRLDLFNGIGARGNGLLRWTRLVS